MKNFRIIALLLLLPILGFSQSTESSLTSSFDEQAQLMSYEFSSYFKLNESQANRVLDINKTYLYKLTNMTSSDMPETTKESSIDYIKDWRTNELKKVLTEKQWDWYADFCAKSSYNNF